MNWIKCLLVFIASWASTGLAQNPVLTIDPNGTTSVCSGTSVSVSSSMSNAFSGTNSYAVSDVPFTPYPVLGANALTMVDDQVIGPLPIGFQFCFFGNTYTQFYVGSNGWVGFTPGQTIAFTANTIPNPGVFVPRNCIMGPWMDWNPGVGTGSPYIRYQTQGIAPYRRLVVQWTACPLYQCTASNGTFQIVIYESTNIIENFITNKPVCSVWAGGTATQGLHNMSGTVAVTAPGRNSSVWTANNDGKRFTPNGPPSYTLNWTSNGFPIGTGPNVTTTINGPGITRIIARANFQCSNLILYDTLDVTIGGAANADFSGPTTVCAGQPATFNYIGGVTGSGNWTFSGASPASASGLGNQTVTWNTPGTYTVDLTVSPSSGLCAAGSTSQTITVVAPPASPFNLPASVCAGNSATISFAGGAPPGSIFAWDFGADASPATASNVGPHNVSWSSAGTKTVSLTLNTGACPSTTTHTIDVTNAPSSTFSSASSSVCAGDLNTFTFTGTAPAGASFTWDFGPGASPATASTIGPHDVSWSSAGPKNVTLSVSSGGCNSPVTTQIVNVNNVPTANFVIPSDVCIGSNASISYNGSAPAPPTATYTWSVDGASSNPGNVQGPFGLSWSTAGVKNVSLTVSQSGCISSPVSQAIAVNALPLVTISSSSPSACVGNNVSYSINGGATPGATYVWNFGADATPATSTASVPPSVSYSSSGTKTISLIATEGGCSSLPSTVNVVIQDPPPAVISAPSNACEGSAVSISANGPFSPGTTFLWNFGTGVVSSGAGAGPYQVTWASAATETISLTVTSGSCSSSASQNIIIRTGPTASFSAPSPVCEGQSSIITYTGNGIAGDTYAWDFGVGASPATATGIGPHSVLWSSSGSKTISLNMSSGSCAAAPVSQVITVSPGPVASILAPTPVCTGNASVVSFNGTPEVGATYVWDFGSNASPATANGIGPHNVSWSAAGNSTISLTMDNGSCSSTVNQAVTINSGAGAAINAPAIAGDGVAVSIALSGPAQLGASYSWDFGANASPATANGPGPHNVTYNGIGTSQIQLTSSLNGCTSSVTQNIAIVSAITSTFTATPIVCSGSNALVSYTGTASSSASYSWDFDGGTANSGVGQGPHTVSWTSAGTKTITLTVTEGGFTSTVSSQNVTVNPTPTSTFNLPASACVGNTVNVSYTGNGLPGALYAWNFGANASPASIMSQGPHNLTYSTAGNSTVSLQVIQSGCTSTTTTHSITVNNPPNASFTLPADACIGETMNVGINGSASPGVNYAWNFGAGSTPATATGSGPHSVSWGTHGPKTVSLIASSGTCSSASITQSIVINANPTATFTSVTPACEGDLVTLTYTGNAGAGANYSWSYPSATFVSGSANGPIEIQYPTQGNYTVSLEVEENSCTSAIETQAINIESAPVFTISSPAFAGENAAVSVTYSGEMPVGATYTWDFQGATVISGSGSGPYQVSWAAPGIYTISCEVSNGVCPPVTATTNTEVIQNAIATFTAESPVCEDVISSILFTGTTLPGSTYSWDFGGGQIISGSASGPFEITWDTPGIKNISLVVNQMGIDSPVMTQQVLVNQIPTALFTAPPTLCFGQDATFIYTGNASNTATYNWNFGSGNLVSSTNGVSYDVNYPAEGSENVALTVTENGCVSSTESAQIFVQSGPSATFTLGTSACQGSIETITYTGDADPSSSFNWDFGGGNIISGSGSGPFEIEFATPGIQTVSLETSYGGCSSVLETNSININATPSPTFTLNGNTCAGDTVTVTYTGNAGPTAEYFWDFEALVFYEGDGSGPYQTVFPGYGTFPVGLFITENGCQSEIGVESFTFDPSPTASFTINDTVYVNQEVLVDFTGFAPENTNTTWDYPSATFISGGPEDEFILTYDTPGTYDVSLEMVLGGCADGPVSQQVVVLPLPGSDFSVSNDTICAAQMVAVTYSGIGNSQAAYLWDFDGGEIVNGIGAGPYEISFESPGTKNISLHVIVDGIVSDTTFQTVEVIAIPDASFSMPDALCLGDTLEATYLGATAALAQFSWNSDSADYEDLSDVTNPSFSWNTAGQKTVVLNIAEAMCISEPVMHTIMVNEVPQASFILPEFACIGAPVEVTYNGNAGLGSDFDWNFEGVTIIDGSGAGPIEMLWSEPGNKLVTLQVEENGCVSEVFSQMIQVRVLPFADAGVDVQFCSEDTISLAATSLSGYSFQWFPSAGLSDDTIANPELSLEAIHNYIEEFEYALEVSDGYCLNYDTLQVALAPKPRASFILPDDQCYEGNSFDFINDGAYTDDASFNWNLGPHAYTHSPNEEHQSGISFDVEGPQTVSLVISQYGCVSDVFSATVNVNPHPTATFDVDGEKGCVPLASEFTPIPQGAGNLSYSWDFGDGNISNETNPGHIYTESGYMTVTMIASNEFGCTFEDTQVSAVQVLEQPVAGFRAQPETIYIGADELELISLAENAQFSYYVIEGDTILGFTNTYSFTEEGVYEITQVVVNAAGCSDEITHSVVVEYGTEYYIPSAFSPNNDGHNEQFLVVGSEVRQFTLTIFDRWGSEIFRTDDMNEGWDGKSVNDEPLPEGVYVYRLTMRSNTNRDIIKNGQVTLLR